MLLKDSPRHDDRRIVAACNVGTDPVMARDRRGIEHGMVLDRADDQQVAALALFVVDLGADVLRGQVALVLDAVDDQLVVVGVGELMLIADHINLLPENPLTGPNLDALGPRFPDMSAAYDPLLQRIAQEVALERGIALRRGVYVAVPGPNLETAAEYRMLRTLGADVVGMSTVPEVIAAVHAGMRVLGLSVITDACLPDALRPTSLEEILATARGAEPNLARVVRGVLARMTTEAEERV